MSLSDWWGFMIKVWSYDFHCVVNIVEYMMKPVLRDMTNRDVLNVWSKCDVLLYDDYSDLFEY